MTRSAVRSRLAPPRFAFGYAWRSHVSRRRSVPDIARRATTGWRDHPQSTSIVSCLRLRVAQPRKPKAKRARHSPKGDDGLETPPPASPSFPRKPRRPLFHKARDTFAEIAAPQRHHHLPVGVDGGLGQGLERHIVELPLDDRDRAW